MSLDAPRTEPRPERLTAHEARRRLEHARATRMTQLRALGESGQADSQLIAAQQEAIGRVLKEIEAAFARVDDGTYGACLGCGKPVPGERLEILPYTRYCVACQRRAAA
ncbi:TraR/DksA C4-type zinc finger protein [Streptomyces sp. SID5789]|uniref:TraR/DksA C4-type zinc finger protein n=1 Tax=Streptomyces sp. SID5789 TaxID=2690310 RepID=UPI001367D65B|nr:molecular chaperone DnaK [Streptomyces sp. SID5789]